MIVIITSYHYHDIQAVLHSSIAKIALRTRSSTLAYRHLIYMCWMLRSKDLASLQCYLWHGELLDLQFCIDEFFDLLTRVLCLQIAFDLFGLRNNFTKPFILILLKKTIGQVFCECGANVYLICLLQQLGEIEL